MPAPPALCADLQAKLAIYRTKRAFEPKAWIAKKTKALNEYMSNAGLKACITSVSGGIDSAVSLALCAEAKKLEGSPIAHVVGVCQPIQSSAWALERGRENIKACNAEEITVDQTQYHKDLCKTIDTAAKIEGGSFAQGQLRSYMRTPVGYYVAQLYSQNKTPAIVMGTGNMDEDGYLAYFCKAGDGVVDVQLISDLHKSEVFVIAEALGVPTNTRVAPPSADLWDGQTDEEELGFTYDFIELYVGYFLKLSEAEQAAFVADLGAEGKTQFEAWSKAAVGVHNRNKHKLNGIVNL